MRPGFPFTRVITARQVRGRYLSTLLLFFFSVSNSSYAAEAVRENSQTTAGTVSPESIQATFLKGKQAYDAGDTASALRIWETLDPYLASYPSIRKVIQYLKAQASAPRPRADVDIGAGLESAAEQVEINRAESERARDALASKGQGREDWIRESFEKGRAAAADGDWATAIEQWDRLASYLDESAPERKTIEALKRDYFASEKMRAETRRALESSKTKLKAPKGLAEAIEAAKSKLRSELSQVSKETTTASKGHTEREAWIDAALVRARSAYEAGRIEPAILEWERTLPFLENEAELREAIKNLRENLRSLEDVRAQGDAAAADNFGKLKIVLNGRLEAEIARAAEILRQRSGRTQEEMEKAQQSLAERQEWVESQFQKGKKSADSGRMTQAVAEWEPIVPYLQEAETVRPALEQLRAAVTEADNAQTESATRAASLDKLRAPAEMLSTIEQANREAAERNKKLLQNIEEARRVADRRVNAVSERFEKGKALYAKGQLWEASEAWKGLIDDVQEGPQIREWMGEFSQAYREYLDAKEQLDQLEAEKAKALSAPADLLKFLSQAQRDAEAQRDAAVTERVAIEKGKKEHIAWVHDTFQKGKGLADQGNIESAINEWERLLLHLDDSSPERTTILELRKRRQEIAAEREKVNRLALASGGRTEAPADLRVVLDAASDSMDANRKRIDQERVAIDKSISERRGTMLEILQKGQMLFDSGKYAEAITEWKALLQYVDSQSGLKDRIREAEENLRAYEKSKNTLIEAQVQGGSKFKTPEGLDEALTEAAKRLRQESTAANTQRSQWEKNLTEKQVWFDETFHAGRQHYEAGRLEQAVEEWAKLGPYLPEGTGLPVRLADLRAVKNEAVTAKKMAVETAAQGYKGLKIDSSWSGYLSDALKKLQARTDESRKEAEAAGRKARSSAQSAEAILKEGKALFDASDEAGAVAVWTRLLAVLDPDSPAYGAVESLRRSHEQWELARKEAMTAQAQPAAFALPDDFKKMLSEAAARLKQKAREASVVREQTETARRAHEKTIHTAFEQSKDKFWGGDPAGAIAGWKALAPEVEGMTEIVQGLEAERNTADQARLAAAQAAELAQVKLEMPTEFAQLVEKARQQIRVEWTTQQEKLSMAQGSLASRKQTLAQAFERGKALYWQGNLDEAIAEWDAVISQVEDAETNAGFQDLKKLRRKTLEAAQSAEKASSDSQAKLAPPAELAKLMDLARQKLASDLQAARDQKSKLEADLAARRAKVEEAFQRGAVLATAGKLEEALAEWKALAGPVGDESGVPATLVDLETALNAARAAREDADAYAAGEFKDIRFTHGDEIHKIVTSAQSRLAAQTAEARKRRADMEKTFADRQAWVESTFQKGKVLFEQGRYAEALEFWKSLSPYLVDGVQTNAMLEQFARTQEETASAVADALDADSKKDTLFQAPTDIAAMLASATEKIKTMHFEARTRRERVEQALSDRRIAIQAAYDKGRAVLEKGSIPVALDEWEKMLPMVEDSARIKESLNGVRLAYQQSTEARQGAEEAEKRKDAPLPIPPELRSTLESVSDRMKKEIQAADLHSEKMEKTLSDRRAYVRDFYDRGKALYDEGKLREAFDLWKTIGPFTDEEEKLNELLSKAGQAYDNFVGAKAKSHEAALKQSSKLESPPELLAILDAAVTKLKKDDFDSRSQTFEIEKSIADRREWINSNFKKGQALYLEGRYPEAVAEWNTILPYLEDGIEVKATLVEIDKNAALAEKSKKILAQSQETWKLQFHSPKELSELLLKANEDLKNQMFTASAEKMKAEQTLSERQKWMNQTFQLGRSFYAEGKIGEALAEWSKLKPYLDGQPAIEEMMKTLQTSYDALQKTKKEAVEATAEDYKGLKLVYSDQMAKVLEQAVQKINDETLSLREKLEKTHETLAERKEWSVTTFNKGKVFYDDGRHAEALEQWVRLLPYLEKDSQIKALIESFQKSFAEWSDRTGAIGELEQRTEKPVALAQPEMMAVTFKDAADKMKAQADAASARSADLEKSLSQRKDWIAFTYEKGKKLFDQGQYADAVTEWGVLGPYLSEHPDVRAEIEEAKRSYVQFRKADQILQNAETKKAVLPALPEDAFVPPPAEIPKSAAPAVSEQISEPSSESSSVLPPPAAEKPKLTPEQEAHELVSGEVLSVDRTTSVFYLRAFIDQSEMSVRFDGATQFDGQAGVTADKLQKGVSVDARVDSDNRASYVYIY